VTVRNGELKQRSRSSKPKSKSKPVVPAAVVGVGVCLASQASLELLFAHFPPRLGAAYLIAVRQQDGLSVDTVVEALRRQGRMPVSIPGDGEPIEANHIYVGGRDALITVQGGRVRSHPAEEPIGQRGVVDSLLLSISESYHERSVAVILSGLGSDGIAGVAATKSCGGLAVAERRGEEELATEAVTAAGIADLLLPVEEIPSQVAGYVRNLVRVEEAGGLEALQKEASTHLARISTILRNATGNDFHGYKENTFLRRVARRMQVVGDEHIEAYIERLHGNPREVQHLFQDLLIGVTQFFRDPAEFGVLEREAIPEIFKGKKPEDQVRVWVVGCATGEEAYSLAILLREQMERLDRPPHVQIFATDLDARALAIARAGRYPEGALQHQVSAERLSRWFVKEGATYTVSKQLREMCIFSPHNVLKDAPFSRIDLLSCRNLLIYLNADLQTRVIPIFHFSLKQDGYLFLGNAENVTKHAKLFAPLDRKNRVFKRLETSTRILPEFPLASGPRRLGDAHLATAPWRRSSVAGVGRRAELVAERYAPAYVVVDEQGDVLHFSGRTGRYLEPAAGVATLNILGLVHRELRLDLRTALHKAATLGGPVETPRVQLNIDGQVTAVSIVVERVGGGQEPTTMVVIFQDGGAVPDGLVAGVEHGLVSDEHVQRLEGELRVTKDRLQATIEELESTNEELKSSNEEYQSINEELQSANEELETSREELQSINEELQTVNHELANRVAELGRTHSDLQNLFESTQIATVFLDNDLRVRSFTPAATETFHLLDSDIGRPIGHIGARIEYPELQEDVRKVIRSLAPVQREVTAEGDARYFARVLPYRSTENVIAGAVITFLDVTATARAEAALRASEGRLRLIMEEARDYAIFTTDPENRVENWFPGAEAVFGWTAEEAKDQLADFIFVPEDRARGIPGFEFDEARQNGFAPDVRWHQCKDGSRVFIEGSTRALRGPDGAFRGLFKIGRDVTERHRAEERQKLLLAELQHRVRNILTVVRSVASRTGESTQDVDDFLSHFDGRLATLARTQSAVTRTEDVAVDLEELVRDELLAVAADEDRIEVSGPSVRLRQRAAENLALAVHELTTNAVKYGALSAPDGRLTVTWKVHKPNGHQLLSLHWKESGVRAIEANPKRTGFGRSLIERALPYELGADTSLKFAGGGVRATIELPLTADNAVIE
jgi:two-component system CheB/CheR fusion protein